VSVGQQMHDGMLLPGRYEAEHVSPNAVAALIRHRRLLANLVLRDIKVRYKRSILGFGWMFLNPLISMVIFTIVFSHVFSRMEHYSLYVIVGLLAWNLFSLGTAQGVRSLVINGGLMRKVYLPKAVFPIASVTSNLINLLFSFIPLFLYMLAIGAPLSRHLVWLPVSVLTLYVFAIGIAMAIGTLNVFFRDVQFFYDAALAAWFYATPIFYPADIIPSSRRIILHLNPIYEIVRAFRSPLYLAEPPRALTLVTSLAIAVGTLLFGWWIFHRYEDRFINYV
jgi:homopolymeric O-antigen transport system permease protein